MSGVPLSMTNENGEVIIQYVSAEQENIDPQQLQQQQPQQQQQRVSQTQHRVYLLRAINCDYTFEKRYYVFHPPSLGLSVCVCVCVCVCLSVITFVARWLDLATWHQVRSILSKRT